LEERRRKGMEYSKKRKEYRELCEEGKRRGKMKSGRKEHWR